MYETLVFLFFEYRIINSNAFCIDCVILYNAVECIVNITDLEKNSFFDTANHNRIRVWVIIML